MLRDAVERLTAATNALTSTVRDGEVPAHVLDRVDVAELTEQLHDGEIVVTRLLAAGGAHAWADAMLAQRAQRPNLHEAAPELLAALHDAAKVITALLGSAKDDWWAKSPTAQRVRAAIAKAEGRT